MLHLNVFKDIKHNLAFLLFVLDDFSTVYLSAVDVGIVAQTFINK